MKKESSNDTTEQIEQRREEAVAFGSAELKRNGKNIHCLTIIGQIEGHQVLAETVKTTKYEHVIPQIAAIEESEDIDGLLILSIPWAETLKRDWPLRS